MPPNQATVLHGFDQLFTWDADRIRRVFEQACGRFVQSQDGTVEIWAASTDWFLEEWGRDTFIALPGILLANRRFSAAKSVFRHFAAHARNGLIPNRIRPDEVLYNTVDAPLWFIVALAQFERAAGDRAFVAELLPVVRAIVDAYRQGTGYERGGWREIRMDTDGLIVSPAQATWMDADLSGQGTENVTPRNGKAVEINALWYAALGAAEEFCAMCPQVLPETWRREVTSVRAQVRAHFATRFWNAAEGCLYDVIAGDPHGAAIRPNQILAVSHGHDLLTAEQCRQVFTVITRELLTPGGLRTLSPRDSHYRGTYNTQAPLREKDQAYHQGTVWPWLMGPYGDALVRVRLDEGRDLTTIRLELRAILEPLVRFCLESEVQSLPEVFSGDAPHEPGGTRSQAWSVAEVWSLLRQYRLV